MRQQHYEASCYTLFYLLMMPAARLVCQRPSSNFPYFRTPLANVLLSSPNSVENGNSKTTTLLPSAKCTRPLFQGRTGCGGRPSGPGWHDIVTCQRLVVLLSLWKCPLMVSNETLNYEYRWEFSCCRETAPHCMLFRDVIVHRNRETFAQRRCTRSDMSTFY